MGRICLIRIIPKICIRIWTWNRPASREGSFYQSVPNSNENEKRAELLFTNSVSPNSKKSEEESVVGGNKTLSESAAEYTESHNSNKRKYDVVDVVTGEETESNVLQANVKLYIFDTDKKNWVERGRGTLRLNDDPSSTLGHLR